MKNFQRIKYIFEEYSRNLVSQDTLIIDLPNKHINIDASSTDNFSFKKSQKYGEIKTLIQLINDFTINGIIYSASLIFRFQTDLVYYSWIAALLIVK
jgi:hypothetical protein